MTLTRIDYWRLADDLSVIDAAILITGNDPSEKQEVYEADGTVWVQKTDYEGYEATFKALTNAVLSNKLAASVVFPVAPRGFEPEWSPLTVALRGGGKLFQAKSLNFYDHDSLVFLQAEPDWTRTTVELPDLKSWLKRRGVFPPFFFPEGDPESALNREHRRYSPKLACALSAWRAITCAAKNKSVKQTIEDWVAAHGVQFGLRNEEGVVPQTAKEEIAKVVNWQPQGGAPQTGGQVSNGPDEDPETPPDNFVELNVYADEAGRKLTVTPF